VTPDTRGCEIDIRELVDRLDELVAQGWRVPLSDRVVVERTALLNLLDQMRIAIPQEIQRASALEQERDRVLALANSQAE